MNKIAIFGKPGGGKSTLSKNLAAATGVNLYALDSIKYNKNGTPVSLEDYSKEHDYLIAKESWIIEGLGTVESFWKRIAAADILIFVDLPYYVHYWWVIKRLLKSFVVKPEGWPDDCSVLKGTILSLKNLSLSPKFWTTKLFDKIKEQGKNKNIYRITSIKELNSFAQQFSVRTQ